MEESKELATLMDPANFSKGDVIEVRITVVKYNGWEFGKFFLPKDKPDVQGEIQDWWLSKNGKRVFDHRLIKIDTYDDLYVVDMNIIDGEKLRIHKFSDEPNVENTKLLSYDTIIKMKSLKIGKLVKKNWWSKKLVIERI